MLTGVGNQVLLRTKLYRPRVNADLVDRPRLKELLDGGLSRSLILITAPAGFGKTTLLSAWLDTCKQPSAWLSLDEHDNNLSVFLAYFVGAVQTIFPDALAETQMLLSGVTIPPVTILCGALINELDELGRDFVLVLDDYQIVRDQSIHELLATLLQHPPKGLHLVITTRQDPQLSLAVLRARARLTEIRSQDLRFTLPEIATFVAQTLGTALADDAFAVLAQKTEGWAAGLRMATLTLRHGGDITGHVAGLHAENRYVMDYLTGEVLSHVPPAIESFLLRTSILDRLCAPLCQEVVGLENAECQPQECLNWLERNGVFTQSLDTKGQWYRYHHLFQELLRAQLMRKSDAGEVAALHLRASQWFAGNGFVEEALRHALAGQEPAAAIELMAQHRHALMNDEQWQRLERWLALFPDETVAEQVELLLTKAWLIDLDMTGSADSAETLDQAERLVARMTNPPEHVRHLTGEIAALRAKLATWRAQDLDRLLALSLYALENTPKSWYMVRAVAWLRVATVHQIGGRLDRAYAALNEGAREDTPAVGPIRGRIRGTGCIIHWMAGNLPAIEQTATRALEVIRPTSQGDSYSWSRLFLSMVAYQRNDLTSAEQHAWAVEERRYAGVIAAGIQSIILRALIHQARGEPEQARQVAAEARRYLIEIHRERLMPFAEAFQAELAMRQGDLAAADLWAAGAGHSLPPTVMAWFYQPQLAQPKIRLAQNTPASRREAAEALSRLYDFVTRTHNTRFTIEVLALQALLQDAQGDQRAALALVRQAVLLAEPGGFIRLFADLGPRMAGLLARLVPTGVAPDYTGRILQAFDNPAPAAPPQRATVSALEGPDLVEPLTEREREILAFLALRWSDKEIAQALVISLLTVKKHTRNIYQKLQVSSRREAVAKALRLGLL
jgi:LuxR family maltose regulon positive regulatory protein